MHSINSRQITLPFRRTDSIKRSPIHPKRNNCNVHVRAGKVNRIKFAVVEVNNTINIKTQITIELPTKLNRFAIEKMPSTSSHNLFNYYYLFFISIFV